MGTKRNLKKENRTLKENIKRLKLEKEALFNQCANLELDKKHLQGELETVKKLSINKADRLFEVRGENRKLTAKVDSSTKIIAKKIEKMNNFENRASFAINQLQEQLNNANFLLNRKRKTIKYLQNSHLILGIILILILVVVK